MAGPRSLLAAEHNSNRVNVFNGRNMDPVFQFSCVSNAWWSAFCQMRCCEIKNCKMFPHNDNDALLVAKSFINNSCGFPFDVKL